MSSLTTAEFVETAPGQGFYGGRSLLQSRTRTPAHTPINREKIRLKRKMVPGNGSQLCAYAPTSLSDANTISISIRRGIDGRASSIVLPREHHLVRNLERLMTYDSVQSPQQPEYDVVSALSSVVKYIHTNNPLPEAPNSSLAALFSSLRPPSDHARSKQRPAEQPMRRRSSKGRTRTTKHCKVLGCGNISVSRGLCRGHGGGRRCHYIGCSKSAQSRSVFCWSHGGGHRCEVENCMRSRKSKRFCADHVHLETQQAPRKAIDSLKMILNDVDKEVPTQMSRDASLPSLRDALRNTQQTMMF